jgi:tryptophan synthase beta chain
VFESARLFLETEGFLAAPETAHAIKGAIDEAKNAPEGKVIVFLYSGHGLLDLGAYDAYLRGDLSDFSYPDEKIKECLQACPVVKAG